MLYRLYLLQSAPVEKVKKRHPIRSILSITDQRVVKTKRYGTWMFQNLAPLNQRNSFQHLKKYCHEEQAKIIISSQRPTYHLTSSNKESPQFTSYNLWEENCLLHIVDCNFQKLLYNIYFGRCHTGNTRNQMKKCSNAKPMSQINM